MAGYAKFGRPSPVYGGILVKQIGTISNVAYDNPFVGEIPFAACARLERIKLRNVTPGATYRTKIELFDCPPAVADEFNVIYYNEGFYSDHMLDDILTSIPYASEDGTPWIWIRVTPEQGTSNTFKLRIDGTLAVAAPALPPI